MMLLEIIKVKIMSFVIDPEFKEKFDLLNAAAEVEAMTLKDSETYDSRKLIHPALLLVNPQFSVAERLQRLYKRNFREEYDPAVNREKEKNIALRSTRSSNTERLSPPTIPELPVLIQMRKLFVRMTFNRAFSSSRQFDDSRTYQENEKLLNELNAGLMKKMEFFNGSYNAQLKYRYPGLLPGDDIVKEVQDEFMRDHAENMKSELNQIVKASKLNKHRTPWAVRVLFKIAMFIASFAVVPAIVKAIKTKYETGSATVLWDLTTSAGTMNNIALGVVDQCTSKPRPSKRKSVLEQAAAIWVEAGR